MRHVRRGTHRVARKRGMQPCVRAAGSATSFYEGSGTITMSAVHINPTLSLFQLYGNRTATIALPYTGCSGSVRTQSRRGLICIASGQGPDQQLAAC